MERWKPCPEFEDRYLVSDLGRVKTIHKSKIAPAGTVLKPRLHTTGYPVVNLWRNNRQVTRRVHRLVAIAFLGSRPEMEVNHKDGDKTNASLMNLEWVTHAENGRHAIRVLGNAPGGTGRVASQSERALRRRQMSGEGCPTAKLTDMQVRVIRRLHRRVPARIVAELFEVSRSHVSNIQGRRSRRLATGGVPHPRA